MRDGVPPPVSLRLTTDNDTTIEHHCPLCLFLHDSTDCENRHDRHINKDVSRPTSRLSDASCYSERTTDHFAFFGSTRGLRVRVIATPLKQKPVLRRKMSPTDVSLRELRAKQERQVLIRLQRSEEQLQQVYECQILAYLESPLAEMGFF